MRKAFSEEARTKWFREARFGMFIHWGLYSILGRGEWVQMNEAIPTQEYALLADRFDPKRYDPHEWVALAQEAGMKYVVLTTRHHDGYSLFDSQVSDFTSVKTRPGRDLVAEFVQACRKARMKIGLYYSLVDWRCPAFFYGPDQDPKGWKELVAYVHAQVRELCTNYGKIDIIWYDGAGPYGARAWQSNKLNATVRELQPHILTNNRSERTRRSGDYDTPEQRITASKRPWETCMTMNDYWGYAAADRNWKSSTQLIRNLVQCTAWGGNYLLNIGPKADGTFPGKAVTRLKEIGAWMKANGESIYGADKFPFGRGGWVKLTTKGNTLYLHVWCWPGEELCVAGIKSKVKSAHLLATGRKLRVKQEGDRVFLHGLPKAAPDPHDTVIALKFDGKPEAAKERPF